MGPITASIFSLKNRLPGGSAKVAHAPPLVIASVAIPTHSLGVRSAKSVLSLQSPKFLEPLTSSLAVRKSVKLTDESLPLSAELIVAFTAAPTSQVTGKTRSEIGSIVADSQQQLRSEEPKKQLPLPPKSDLLPHC
ncbi:hypothetical protein TorRG33x02_234790 [Trema orientale]|uniref:Uncharacterized protein n=1 Tax=Trema orientale TaxID=63057 RepID=A0A2P5E2W0_TREOI|nr:hypothetical protein TorRG33x02_234790 [Trema orientale]